MKGTYHILRKHIVTGFIFLMPVFITISVVSKYWSRLITLGGKLNRLFFLDTLLGTTGDAVMAVLLLLLLCSVAGFLVKMTIFKSLSDKIDGWLGSLIPTYNTLKSSTLKNLGSKIDEPDYPTCLVNVQGLWQPAYLISKKEDGSVVAFVPNAPNTSTGQVYLANPSQWKELDKDMASLNSSLKKLGAGL